MQFLFEGQESELITCEYPGNKMSYFIMYCTRNFSYTRLWFDINTRIAANRTVVSFLTTGKHIESFVCIASSRFKGFLYDAIQ